MSFPDNFEDQFVEILTAMVEPKSPLFEMQAAGA
jgi:hypothetical protein